MKDVKCKLKILLDAYYYNKNLLEIIIWVNPNTYFENYRYGKFKIMI